MRPVVPALLLALLGSQAFASDLPRRASIASVPAPAAWAPPSGIELRLGGFAHDIGGVEDGSVDVNLEALSGRLFNAGSDVANLFVPRFHAGGSISTSGDTSFGYAGFTWTFDVTDRLFIEGAFGGAVNNGNTGAPRDGEAALGCALTFREAASIGYRLDRNWSVMATVEHISNAGFCSRNAGLTNVGMRIGYVF